MEGAESAQNHDSVYGNEHDCNLDQCKICLDVITEGGHQELLREELDSNEVSAFIELGNFLTKSSFPEHVEAHFEVVVSALFDGEAETGGLCLSHVVGAGAEVLVNICWLSLC